MRPGPAGGAARARARGGIAPALLLDVQTPFGEVYYWSDRALRNIKPVLQPAMEAPVTGIATATWSHDAETATLVFETAAAYIDGQTVTLAGLTALVFLNGISGVVTYPDRGARKTMLFAPLAPIVQADVAATAETGTATVVQPAVVDYQPWLLGAASLTFNRSLQTDTGSLLAQDLSGDVLQRDFERIVRRGVLEGSLFVLRYYAVDLEWAWIEQHGTLTVGDTADTVQLNLQQLLAGADDTPEQTVSETCQLVWGRPRCGATGDVECLYTFSSCQVPERFTGIQTGFELNNPNSVADLPITTINRKRAW